MKLSIAAILLGVFALKSFAQSYVPIPDNNAVWRESWGFGHNIDNNTTEIHQQLFTGATVTFDSLEYFEIHKTGYGISMIPFYNGGFTNQLVCYLRNDTAQQRVYIRNLLGFEQILYDFNLQPGDTIPHSWYGMLNTNGQDSVVVDSITTVWFGNVPHRWFALSCYTSGFWLCSKSALIEGVGCIHGLLNPISNCTETGWYGLECFSHNDSAYTFSDNNVAYAGSTCWLYSNVKPLDNTPYELSVYLNPLSSVLHVQVHGAYEGGFTFSVFDPTGKQLTTRHLSDSKAYINSEDWPSGIYFWLVSQGNQVLGTGKVVK